MMAQKQTVNNQAGFLQSKFSRIFMMLVTMLLIFAGPTYVPYAMFDLAGIDYIASVVTGLLLFVVGLGMMVYLIKKKVIS
jgi:uncharacterized protein YybS (DUF2232 family)